MDTQLTIWIFSILAIFVNIAHFAFFSGHSCHLRGVSLIVDRTILPLSFI
jgi:hypothetical protein